MVVLLEAQTPGTWSESIHIDIARVLQALPEQGTWTWTSCEAFQKTESSQTAEDNYAL